MSIILSIFWFNFNIRSSGLKIAKIGAWSNLSSDDLASISSITRGLKDAVATVPFVNVYSLSFEDDDQEGFTIAGQNPRYSTFSVDGVAQNDDFGLEKQGYPTIQSPISLDALDQVTVTVTDYDVRYSGTSAGNINAVTKSGTNEFKGSVFGYIQDDSLRGDTVDGFKPTTGEYEEETIGFTFGGPIIKDKLFFFLNVDDFEKTQPGEFGAATVVQKDSTSNKAFKIIDRKLYTQFSNNIRSNYSYLNRAAVDSKNNEDLLFHQNGRGVFKDVCPLVATLISEQLKKNKISPEEISKFWLHQANWKMIRLITSKILGTDDFDENITPMPITEFGNLASVGSLFAFNLNNDLAKGQKGVICSFGAGYSVCSIIVEKS